MATYTIEQVQQHHTDDDIWIVLHNKVYDIAKYLEDHPGGKQVLVEAAGTDATAAFEEVGHSDEAREELGRFYVGSLHSKDQAEEIEVYRPTFEQVSQSSAVSVKKSSSKGSLIHTASKASAIGLAIAAIAAAYNHDLNPSQVFRMLRSFPSSIHLHKGLVNGSASHFWAGMAIASVAQLSVTLGLGLWASTKLDVEQDFTHYAPRRATKAESLIWLPKTDVAVSKPSPLNPRLWRQFIMTAKTEVAPHVYHIVFALPKPDDVLGLPTGQHIALRATIDGQSVARSYTPISNNRDLGRIELIIKVYPNGAMTKHLERMKIGDAIEIRGPKGAMQYSRQYAKNIGMIAGGTGITPMYQLIRAACEDAADQTKISLLYANNTEDDILMRKELDDFAKKHPQKFQVQYVLSQPNEKWKGERGFVTADMISKYLAPAKAENKILLCGPPPMINAMKKSLEPMGWAMPGAMSKAGDQVFLF